MKKIALAISFLQFLGVVSASGVTKEKEIDLALIPSGTTATRPARPGDEMSFRLKNTIPGKIYEVSVERELVPIAVLPNIFAPTKDEPTEDALERSRTDCERVLVAIKSALPKASDEKAVAAAIKDLWKDPRVKTCDQAGKERLENTITELTTLTVDGAYDVLAGELLRVTVTRQDDASRVWTYVVSTGDRGAWRISYGFTFVPNEDEEYFTKQNGEEFVITREADREDFDFAPSVMLTWLPTGQRAKSWANGFTAGLGFDLDDPVLFAGWGLTYSENVMVTAGLVVHSQARLGGRFNEGDPIKVNLESSQLLEDTFAANGYFGIAFRFGRNVHADREKAQKEAAAAKEAAAKAKAEKAEAEKKAAEADALRKASCEAEADAKKAEALTKCTQDDATALEACRTLAEANAASAKAKCATAPLDRLAKEQEAAAAKQVAEAARKAAEEKKKACLDLADKTEAASKASCPATPANKKQECETKASKKAAEDRLKCHG